MTKSAYKYIKENIRNNIKEKKIDWRKANSIVKIDKPTDIGRARNLGYKDIKGISIARVKIVRGGRKRSPVKKGRKSRNQTVKKTLKMNYRWVAEQRASRKFKNLEVLNSYLIAKDGIHYFFEVILIDPQRPEIKNSKDFKWILNASSKKRALRGLTSAARKSRGLRSSTINSPKVRPSQRANQRRGK